MLRRIAAFGLDKAAVEVLQRDAASNKTLFLRVAETDPLPAHAVGVIHAGDGVEYALGQALSLADSHNALLMLLARAVDAREDIPAGSSDRVCAYAVRLGETLGLSREDLSTLERGALLRSVGKICIPNRVLLKQSLLDYDDWLLLKSHTTLGATLLTEQGVCADVADIARYYHECWDGTGYPEGLEGEAVPLLARIMRLVDAYCAMTSPRIYRSGQATPEEALRHIQAERGKHFAPDIVDAFVAMCMTDGD